MFAFAKFTTYLDTFSTSQLFHFTHLTSQMNVAWVTSNIHTISCMYIIIYIYIFWMCIFCYPYIIFPKKSLPSAGLPYCSGTTKKEPFSIVGCGTIQPQRAALGNHRFTFMFSKNIPTHMEKTREKMNTRICRFQKHVANSVCCRNSKHFKASLDIQWSINGPTWRECV